MEKDNTSLVEMKIQKILFDQENSISLIFLANIFDEEQVFPIVTGICGTKSIIEIIKGTPFPHPLTHDLLNNVITTLGGKVLHVMIDKLDNDDVVATVHLKRQEKEISIESQACDAIAVALKAQTPIYITKDVLMRYSEIMDEINEINEQDFCEWLSNIDFSPTNRNH
jgi:bifunctional DNase/RNase